MQKLWVKLGKAYKVFEKTKFLTRRTQNTKQGILWKGLRFSSETNKFIRSDSIAYQCQLLRSYHSYFPDTTLDGKKNLL
jgi:hypothetical protein